MIEKKKILTLIVAFIMMAVCIPVFLFGCHNATQRESEINEGIQTIEEWIGNFNSATEHGRRLEIYNGFNDVYHEYINRNSKSTELINMFESSLYEMQDKFFDYYSGRITEVEEVELPEQLEEKMPVISSNIDRLITIKNEVYNDGVFSNNTEKLDLLSDRIEYLQTFLTDTNEWLNSIVTQSEKFLLADNRDEKSVIFNDTVKLHADFVNSGIENVLVDTELNALIIEKRSWFYEWYNNEMISHGSDYLRYLIQLNDLAQLFAIESEIIFTVDDIDMITRNFDNEISDNLTALESQGIRRINERRFLSDANELAIEKYSELFNEWKENLKDNEHLQTYEELLYEAIRIGNEKHITDMLAEETRRTRYGRVRVPP